MLNQIINNIYIILVGIIIFKICNELFRVVLVWTKYRFRKNKIISNEHIQSIVRNNWIINSLKLIINYGVFACLVAIQQIYHFINLGDPNNYVILIISILTIYGIFYTFIQFAINYTLQSGNDRHWGRSKIKTLLMNSVEYKFFNSNNFNTVLVISTIISILNKKTIFDVGLLIVYKDFVMALCDVSIFIIYILYMLLFIKSIYIMRKFFDIQEERDFQIEWIIESNIKDEYKMLFNQSYESKDDLFIKYLLRNTSALKEKEKVNMFIDVIFYSINQLKENQNSEMIKIEHNKIVKPKIMDEFNSRIYYLRNMFFNVWNYIERENLDLDFKILISLYELQRTILFNQMYIANSGNFNNVMEQIISDYNFNSYNLYNEDYILYSEIPNVIWNKITNSINMYILNNCVNHGKVEKEILFKYFNNYKKDELTEKEKIILPIYIKYVYRVLDRYKNLESKINNEDLLDLFGSYDTNKKCIRINLKMQKIIYSYIISLEYNESNKEFISLLLKDLDYKFTVANIFYMMLYTGMDSYSKWKADIKFLRNINYNYYYKEDIKSEENVNFICETIGKSNIGHRINNALIKMIIRNIYGRIKEETIKECISEKYLTYSQLLKFKFIFNEINNFSSYFEDINLNNLLSETTYDWRYQFLEEIVRTPKLLNESFFYEHQYNFYEYILKPNMPKELYITQDFRTLYINVFFKINEEELLKMMNEEFFLRKGIFEFLILKMNDEDYKYLLSNNKISKIFAKNIKEIINSNNVNVECYLNNLVEKANECINQSISDLKKESILYKLNNLIY